MRHLRTIRPETAVERDEDIETVLYGKKDQPKRGCPELCRCGDCELFRIVRDSDGKVINYVYAADSREAWHKCRDAGLENFRVEPERWYL